MDRFTQGAMLRSPRELGFDRKAASGDEPRSCAPQQTMRVPQTKKISLSSPFRLWSPDVPSQWA